MTFDKSLAMTPWMVKQNKDELKGIANFCFGTELEAGLAAMLWLNLPEHKKNQNDFKYQLKHVFRIIELESVWAK